MTFPSFSQKNHLFLELAPFPLQAVGKRKNPNNLTINWGSRKIAWF